MNFIHLRKMVLHQSKEAPLVISLQIYRTNLSTKAAHKMGLASKIEEQKHFLAKVHIFCLPLDISFLGSGH